MSIAFALTSVLLASSPPAAGEHVERVLVSDVRGEGVDEAVLAVVRDAVTAELAKANGVEVVSVAEARRLVDLAADKAGAGCDAATASCQTELAQALGARFVVFGTAARLGDTTVVHLALTDVTRAVVIARSEVQAASRDDLLARVHSGASELRAHIAPSWNAAPVVAGVIAGTAAVVGVVAGVVGVVANGSINNLSLAPQKRKDAEDARNTSYVVAVAAAIVAVGAGVTAWVLE